MKATSPKIAILNAYHCNNLGDRAIVECQIAWCKRYLRANEVSIYSQAWQFNTRHFGEASKPALFVPPLNSGLIAGSLHALADIVLWLTKRGARVAEFQAHDIFVISGGGYLYSSRSPLLSRNMVSLCIQSLAAISTAKPVVPVAQSFGPLKSGIDEDVVNRFCRKMQILAPRDSSSMHWLAERGFSEKALLTPDIVLAMPVLLPEYYDEIAVDTREGLGIAAAEPSFARSFSKADIERYIKSLSDAACDFHRRFGGVIRLFVQVSLPGDDDREVVSLLANRLVELGVPVELIGPEKGLKHYLAAIARCRVFVGSRMHACIFALTTATPVIGLAYQPKFQGLFDHLGMNDWVTDIAFDPSWLRDRLSCAAEQQRSLSDQIRNKMHHIASEILASMTEVARRSGAFAEKDPANRCESSSYLTVGYRTDGKGNSVTCISNRSRDTCVRGDAGLSLDQSGSSSSIGPRADFTIVTPSFRQLPLLKLCVASVRDQAAGSNVSVEHLIQDAESPGINDFVKKIRQAFPPTAGTEYRLDFASEPDDGMYDAINRGFRRANGEIVAWLNSDEQYLPGALTKVSSFFKAYPEIDVVFGDALLVDLSGKPVAYRRCVPPNALHTQIAQLGTLSCATFVRRRVLERGIFPDPTLKAIADAKWIVEMKRSGVRMAVMHEALAIFMLTTTNLGQSSLAKLEMMRWRQQAGLVRNLLRRPIIAWHRLRKMIAGAYWPRLIKTAFYLPEAPLQRIPCVAHRLSHKWPGEQSKSEQKIDGSKILALLTWGVALPFLCSAALHISDRLALGITLTPFLSIVCLLFMAFFLPPATIALAGTIFSVSALLTFLDFANMLSKETADTRFVLIRFASFAAAAIGALMLSIYRQKAGRSRALNTSILTNMPLPLITSDAMGFVTFANDRALQLLKVSEERIIGDKWTDLLMAGVDQGSATRFYLDLFQTKDASQSALLSLSSRPEKSTRANFFCIGQDQDRILLTTLESQEAPYTAHHLSTSGPAAR